MTRSTNLATYNNNLNINTEEKEILIRMDNKRRRNAQKRKNIMLNRFMGGMMVLISLSVYAATEILGGIDNEALLILTALGGYVTMQKERIFNF